MLVANYLLEFSNCRVKEKKMRGYFAERALSIFFGTLGFFLQNHFVNKEQEREINLLLRRVSLLTDLPFHFTSMLLFHRITQRGSRYVVKKRYKYKYFQS